jgi:hypothetical protein
VYPPPQSPSSLTQASTTSAPASPTSAPTNSPRPKSPAPSLQIQKGHSAYNLRPVARGCPHATTTIGLPTTVPISADGPRTQAAPAASASSVADRGWIDGGGRTGGDAASASGAGVAVAGESGSGDWEGTGWGPSEVNAWR